MSVNDRRAPAKTSYDTTTRLDRRGFDRCFDELSGVRRRDSDGGADTEPPAYGRRASLTGGPASRRRRALPRLVPGDTGRSLVRRPAIYTSLPPTGVIFVTEVFVRPRSESGSVNTVRLSSCFFLLLGDYCSADLRASTAYNSTVSPRSKVTI